MKPSLVLLAYGETGYHAYLSLREIFEIKAVVTPPQLVPPSNKLPVEIIAVKDNVRIVRTNSNSEIENLLRKTKPSALVISSYNKILSPNILALTKCINVHHGDLPRWRGRANFNWAILIGRKSVGLTIHEAAPDLDAGNIYAQYMIHISNTDTIKTIYDKANSLLKRNLATVVFRTIKGYRGRPQKGKPTYCCTRLPEDGLIDWNKTSLEIDRLVRSITKPYPGAFTYYNRRKFTIWSVEIPKHPRIYEGRIPGRVVFVYKRQGVEVLTGDSSIIIKDISFAGVDGNASDVIRTVKTSLGINLVELLEKI